MPRWSCQIGRTELDLFSRWSKNQFFILFGVNGFRSEALVTEIGVLVVSRTAFQDEGFGGELGGIGVGEVREEERFRIESGVERMQIALRH